LIELLVVIAIIVLLMALLLPAIQKVRAAADKMTCQNHLKQLGIALQHFHGDYGVFPASGWTQAGPGNSAGVYVGWKAVLLPYIEQDTVRTQYSMANHWWVEPNLSLGGTAIKVFTCPSTPERQYLQSAVPKPPRPFITFPQPPAPCDYEAILGCQPCVEPVLYATAGSNRSAMFRNSSISIPQIYDGSSNTILLVECSGRPLVYRGRKPDYSFLNDQGFGWIDSEGGFSLHGANQDGTLLCLGPILTPKAMNATNENEPYSFHPGGGNFLFADGHVSFIRESIELLTFAALVTKKGGETPLLDDY
jgi:prepilin-type processing-associated H-X9-DG protein